MLTTPVRGEASGGAERYVSEAARAMARRADVSLHYLAARGDGLRDAVPARRHGFVAPPVRERDRLALAPGLAAASAADVVHVHQFGTLSSQWLAALARARRRPVFVTDHGSSGLLQGRRIGLDRLYDGFLAVSEFAASFSPPARTRVVYGGVDGERFSPRARTGAPYALFAGRLMPHKGIDWLIEALPAGARLVVAGRPDERNHPRYLDLLRTLATGKNVDFELDVTDERIVELYAGAHAAVLPSVERDVYGVSHRVPELLGLTVLEAMACATPAVVSRVGPLPELVRDAETGFVVAPGDRAGLATALESLLSGGERAEEMGRRARADVLERFSWDAVTERCLAAYADLRPGR